MAQSKEIQSLIAATRQQAAAEERHAAELAEKNRIERERLRMDEERLRIEHERTEQLSRMIHLVSLCQPHHHEPTMVLLLQIKQDAATLLELSKIIAMRVVGEEETKRLIDTLLEATRRAELVRLDIGGHRVEFDDVRGDVNIENLAGKEITK